MLGNMEAQGKMVNELKFKQERVEGLLEVTKEEEEKGKKELDDKVKVEKDLKFQRNELNEKIEFFETHKKEIIVAKDKESKLLALKKNLTDENDDLDKKNTDYDKQNEELKEANEKLREQIEHTKIKIQLNTLLKEVDIEDIKQLAKNNQLVSNGLESIIKRWDEFEKKL